MISLEEHSNEWLIVFRFDFDPPKVRLIKQLPNPQYRPDLKGWTVLYSPIAAWLCKRFFPQPGYYTDPIPLPYPGLFSWKDREDFDQYQNEGVRFLQRGGNAILADEVGLGKSRQAIGAMERKLPCLIICPSSVVYAWKHEIQKIAKEPRVIVDFILTSQYNSWTILSHEIAARYHRQLVKLDFASCIIDESHVLRNPDTRRTRAILSVATRIPSTLCVTGTPIVNRLPDLITALVATKKMHLNDYAWFVLRYADGKRDRRGRLLGNGVTRAEELKELLSSFVLQRTKDQIPSSIPACNHRVLEVDIDRKKYAEEENEMLTWLQTFGAVPRYRKSKLLRFNRFRYLSAMGKIDTMKQILASARAKKEKTVVVCSFLEPICVLQKEGDLVITGRNTPKQRAEVIGKFQNDPSHLVIFCSMEAGGVGVTLTAANKMYILDFPWSPISLEQSAARIDRRTQTRETEITYIVAKDTVDEPMFRVLQKKTKVANQIFSKAANKQNVISEVETYFKLKRI